VVEDSMEAVIENVGSLVQNLANNVEDKEDEDYGFTSLLSTRNDAVHFPTSYDVPRMNSNIFFRLVKKFVLAVSLIVTSGDSLDLLESRTLAPEPRIPPPEPTKTYNLQRTSHHG
jgi:hypothetical protein